MSGVDIRRDAHGVLLRYVIDAPLKPLTGPHSDRERVMLKLGESALRRLEAILEALEPNERAQTRIEEALHAIEAALGLLRARLA